MNRLLFGDHLIWLRDSIGVFLTGKERVEAPPQLNPFAKAQREGPREKQADLM